MPLYFGTSGAGIVSVALSLLVVVSLAVLAVVWCSVVRLCV